MNRFAFVAVTAMLALCISAQAQFQWPPRPVNAPMPLPTQYPPAPPIPPLPDSTPQMAAPLLLPTQYPTSPPIPPPDPTPRIQAPMQVQATLPPNATFQPRPPTELPPIIIPDRLPPPIPDIERPEPVQAPEMAWVTPPDDHRFWFTADYLLWWVKGSSMPQPLITAGSAADPVPGALGQPNTRVLFGQQTVGFGPASGVRLGSGAWLDANHLWAIESNLFALERKDQRVLFGSGGNSDLVLAQPVIDAQTGAEQAYVVANRNVAGAIFAASTTQLSGIEINGMRNLVRNDTMDFNMLAGFREVVLRDSLTIKTGMEPLQSNLLSFAGQPIVAGDQLYTWDNFHANTYFYGPQLGGKLSWWGNRFGVDVVGKLAMGVSHESASVNGATWLVPAAGNTYTMVPGGILAQNSNIGVYSRDRFAVVPEVNLNLNYDLASWARLSLGYSLIYLSRAVEPGLVLDRAVNPGQVPSSANFGQPAASGNPGFLFHDTDYWAQGVNLGITFRY